MELQAIIDFVAKWFPIATSVVGTFALIAATTPNKSDDKVVQFLLDVINVLGANFGKAANKEGGK